MKTVFLIAGFNMNRTAADKKYDDLRKAIVSKGNKVVPVPFAWNHTTVAQYVDKFVDFYNRHKSNQNIIVGNSYGAMVAFLAAPKVKPDRIILCSLSPYFKEDKDKTTEKYRIKKFGKRRNKAMKQLSAEQTANEINKTNIRVTLLYGEQEKIHVPFLVERVKSTARDLENAELIEVPDASHPFHGPAYIKGIKSVLTK